MTTLYIDKPASDETETLESVMELISCDTVVAIDSEWGNLKTPYKVVAGKQLYKSKVDIISNQMAWRDTAGKKHLLYALDARFPAPDLDVIRAAFPDHTLHFVHEENLQSKSAIDSGIKPGVTMDTLMFYSPVDLRALVGCDVLKEWILGEGSNNTGKVNWKASQQIDKKRKVNGKLVLEDKTTIKLHDVIGTCTAGMNLEGFLESVGVTLKHKQLSAKWDKGDMGTPANNEPTNFALYALGDVVYLEDAVVARVNQVNRMVEDALGWSPEYIAPWKTPVEGQTRFPMSSGKLVSTTFELQQTRLHGDLLAYLNNFVYSETHKEAKKVYAKQREAERNGKVCPKDDKPLEAHNGKGLHHPFSFASIPAVVARASEYGNSSLFNALVFGGRCVNECPERVLIKNVLDIDLNSCYGLALRQFTFPLGFPQTLGYSSNNLKRMTLGEFFKLHCDDLSDNLWQVVVKGSLNFEQDLVFSKINCDERSILRNVMEAFEKDNEDTEKQSGDTVVSMVEREHIKADMVLLRKEIVNGIITSDILRAIEKVSSNSELKGWMNLEVVTAMWYPKSQECKTPEELLEKLKGQKSWNGKNAKGWYGFPLESFVGKFVDQRKVYKKEAKRTGEKFLDDLQNGMKLFINTTYGDFATPFFRMGNVVLANNITAKARLGAWMVAKALGLFQTITDGGMYSWDTVRVLKPELYRGSKPGFHTMANYDRLNQHRSIRVGTMPLEIGGCPVENFVELRWALHEKSVSGLWIQKLAAVSPETFIFIRMLRKFLDGAVTEFETQALNHINSFWANYGMTLPFDIEHKYENTCFKASYNGSANYAMLGVNPDKYKPGKKGVFTHDGLVGIYKVRGANAEDHHNKLELKAIITGDWSHFETVDGFRQVYTKEDKLKQIKAYQNDSAEKRDAEDIEPGESFEVLSYYRPKRNHFPVNTEAEWNTRKEAMRQIESRHKKDVESSTDIENLPLFNPGSSTSKQKKHRLEELKMLSSLN